MRLMKNLLIILGLIVLVTGCASTRLEQPLPSKTRIGVLASFDRQAQFDLVGTTMFQNFQYQHELPDFDPNKLAVIDAAAILRAKGYKVTTIPAPANIRQMEFIHFGFPDQKVVEARHAYLNQLATSYNIDTLLIITQQPVDFRSCERSDFILNLNGYGMLAHSFLGFGHAYLGIGYRLDLIRLQDFAVLASYSDNGMQQEKPTIWKDKFAQIPATDLAYIQKTLAQLLQQSLAKSIPKALSLE